MFEVLILHAGGPPEMLMMTYGGGGREDDAWSYVAPVVRQLSWGKALVSRKCGTRFSSSSDHAFRGCWKSKVRAHLEVFNEFLVLKSSALDNPTLSFCHALFILNNMCYS